MTRLRLSFRWVLVACGLAVALPLIVVLGIFVFQATEFRREQLEHKLQQVANSITEDIDRDIDRSVALLEALASSPLVAKQEWSAFYDQAKAALRPPAYVVLVDMNGRQLVNTFVPFREAPPFTGDPKTLQDMALLAGPTVSNLFTSLVVKKPVYNVIIPILIDGKPQYIFSLGLLPEVLLKILLDQGLDSGWIATVWGADGVMLARSHDHDRFLGSKAPPAFYTQRTGVTALTNLSGQRVLLARSVSKRSGWSVAVSVPMEQYAAAFNRTLFTWLAIALSAIAFAIVIALFLGSRLARPLVSVAENARAFGRNEPLRPVSTWVSEAQDVATAFHEAGERQTLLMRELVHRVKNVLAVVQAVVTKTVIDGRSPKEAREVVSGRLKALALAHDAFIKSDGKGALLKEIITGELGPFMDRVQIAGEPFALSATSAQNFSLVIHELTTNALKHGALSSANGKVFVDWKTEFKDGTGCLSFTWREIGGPKRLNEMQPGFGSTLLQSIFRPHRPMVRFEDDVYTFQLRLPLADLNMSDPK